MQGKETNQCDIPAYTTENLAYGYDLTVDENLFSFLAKRRLN